MKKKAKQRKQEVVEFLFLVFMNKCSIILYVTFWL